MNPSSTMGSGAPLAAGVPAPRDAGQYSGFLPSHGTAGGSPQYYSQSPYNHNHNHNYNHSHSHNHNQNQNQNASPQSSPSYHSPNAPPSTASSSGSVAGSMKGQNNGAAGTSSTGSPSRSQSSHSQPAQQSQQQPSAVPAACLGCRAKHLKCDGQNPCSRCRLSEVECIYVASRRGYKGPRRGTAGHPNKRARSTSPTTSAVQHPMTGMAHVMPPNTDECNLFRFQGVPMGVSAAAPVTTSAGYPMTTSMSPYPMGGAVMPGTPSTIYGGDDGLTHHMAGTPPGHMQLYRHASYPNNTGFGEQQLMMHHQMGGHHAVQPYLQVKSPAERCLDAYYHYFWSSHPFVLPRNWLSRVVGDADIEPLLAAMRWAGSLYIDVGPARATFYEDAMRLVEDPSTKKDGYLVQALIILIVANDGSGQQEKAKALLGEAERIALEIEMNTRSFASIHGKGIPVLEESWRRTWWDLFAVDGMIAATHRQTHFLLFDVAADTMLPCEEDQYLTGHIPQPMSLEDLEDREFSGEQREFSSFAYRVAACRILGKFMRVPPIFGPEDENLARIEALLTNWRLHLPTSKRDALNQKLQADEMIFQASFMTHAISLILHQPHSQLDTSPARSVTSCAPHRPVASGDYFNAHTSHTVRSAAEISKMITHRAPLLTHTHFFTCVITLSSIVHLSKWALFYVPHDDDDLRQQLRLNIGALGELSGVWKAAANASEQVRGVAQEIYRSKKAAQINPAYWAGYTSEEAMTSMAADENIMKEIEIGLAAGDNTVQQQDMGPPPPPTSQPPMSGV